MPMRLLASLLDTEYSLEYIDHIRDIARGVVLNEQNEVAIIKLHGRDAFGDRNYYELPGGGVKKDEDFSSAFKREMEEETGFSVEIIAEIGQVNDFYNKIHRENHQYYYLGKTIKYVGKHLEEYEKSMMEKVIFIPLLDAIELFKNMQDYGCGKLVKNRELPVLIEAKNILDQMKIKY